MSAPKAIFLFTHCRSLGHSTRITNLAHSFMKAFPKGEAWIINGGTEQSEHLNIEGLNWLNLPPYSPQDKMFGELTPIDSSSIGRRRDLIKGLIQKIKPNAFISEFFPFGRDELAQEFIDSIECSKRANKRCHIISSTRDIIGRASNHQEWLELFEQFWIHGDQKFLSFDYPIKKEKVHFTGYLGRAQEFKVSPKKTTRFSICLSIGGGKDGHDLVQALLISMAKSKRNFHIDYLKGPYGITPHFPSNVSGQIHETCNDPRPLMAKANLCISMLGYNTFVDQLQVGTPFIALPRLSDEEQPMRAKAWQHVGGTVLWKARDIEDFDWSAKIPNHNPVNIDGQLYCKKMWRELWD